MVGAVPEKEATWEALEAPVIARTAAMYESDPRSPNTASVRTDGALGAALTPHVTDGT